MTGLGENAFDAKVEAPGTIETAVPPAKVVPTEALVALVVEALVALVVEALVALVAFAAFAELAAMFLNEGGV